MYLRDCWYDLFKDLSKFLYVFVLVLILPSFQISFFKMGSENLSEQLEDFLANIGTSVQK